MKLYLKLKLIIFRTYALLYWKVKFSIDIKLNQLSKNIAWIYMLFLKIIWVTVFKKI